MRTTVTIDPDTEVLLKEATATTGLSFKEVLNQAIRKGLGQRSPENITLTPLFTMPFPNDLQGINFNHLADALDDDATLKELHS